MSRRLRDSGTDRGAVRRAALVCAGLLLAGGCFDPDQALQSEHERRNFEERIGRLEKDLVARDDVIRRQARQIQVLQGFDNEERLAQVPHAVRIEIDPLTGGYDEDRRPGDDGVVVYLRPYDADHDVVKAGGSVRVQVLDLAAPTGAQLLSETVVDAANLRKTWYGKFLTSHYTIRCPWRAGPPLRPAVTVRVEFLDLLSGHTFEQVRQVNVRLAPASRP
jgi:hypothetical protein